MTRDKRKFKLTLEEGYRETDLFEGESIDDILDAAAEKAGRGSFWEALDDGD